MTLRGITINPRTYQYALTLKFPWAFFVDRGCDPSVAVKSELEKPLRHNERVPVSHAGMSKECFATVRGILEAAWQLSKESNGLGGSIRSSKWWG